MSKKLTAAVLALALTATSAAAISTTNQKRYDIDPNLYTNQQLMLLQNAIDKNQTQSSKQHHIESLKRNFQRKNLVNQQLCQSNPGLC